MCVYQHILRVSLLFDFQKSINQKGVSHEIEFN